MSKKILFAYIFVLIYLTIMNFSSILRVSGHGTNSGNNVFTLNLIQFASIFMIISLIIYGSIYVIYKKYPKIFPTKMVLLFSSITIVLNFTIFGFLYLEV